ncbi:MAG TPA: hypothetical protein VHA54_00240, partial [Solirubrobacterales bacterium]|nr:hypothetical protein [Solirubrobacterales bacterium]
MRRRGTVSPARPLSIWGAALCGVVAYALLGLGTAAADSCPNAAIRDDQGTTDLPECRAFEQVTPVEKNEANVSLGKPAQSAEQPGAVAFTTSTGLPGGQTNLSIGYYRAKRGIEGWTTSFYDLPQQNQGTSIVQATRFISSDLTKSVSASQSPLLGITPGGAAVFVHDLESGGATPIAEEPSDVRLEPNWLYTDFLDVSFGPVFGATPDLSQLVFQGRSAF